LISNQAAISDIEFDKQVDKQEIYSTGPALRARSPIPPARHGAPSNELTPAGLKRFDSPGVFPPSFDGFSALEIAIEKLPANYSPGGASLEHPPAK